MRQRFHMLNVILPGTCVTVLIYSLVTIKFWNYSIPPYYQNYIKYVTGKITRDQYFSFFDPTLTEQYRIATYIAMHTNSADRIFIWGDLPSIYALTRRLPPGRFTSAYHIKDFKGEDETIASIVKYTPKYILVDRRTSSFAAMDTILLSRYVNISQSENFILYRRIGKS